MNAHAETSPTQRDDAEAERLDRVVRIIRARCGDVLTEADTASLVRVDIFERVVEVLDLIEQRLQRLEERA
jgi:hypothetical protein